jgi:hypothetical protein
MNVDLDLEWDRIFDLGTATKAVHVHVHVYVHVYVYVHDAAGAFSAGDGPLTKHPP